jgi:ABC-2 type transport system ATP-binding protein
VAAALVTDPAIVLLDEPTIGLDVEAARTVRQWVLRLAHQDGKTIVLTTHQLAMAEELCDRVAVIRQSRIVTDLPTRQLLDRYVEDRFEVEVGGGDASLARALPPDAAVSSADGRATVTLPTADQERLHQVLARLHASAVPVLGVRRVRPSLEAVFVKLVRGE